MLLREQLIQARQLHLAGQLPAAEELYRAILREHPETPQALHGLGVNLTLTARAEEAVELLRKAVALSPSRAGYHLNFGVALNLLGRTSEAAAAFRRALTLKQDYPEAFNNLGQIFVDQGDLQGAVTCFDKALQLRPADPVCASDRLLVLQYDPDYSPQQLLAEHRKWNQRFAAPLAGKIKPHENERSVDRRLRVGYVSGDFFRHSVPYFFASLLEHRDRSQIEAFCYFNGHASDGITARLRASADHWRDIAAMTDDGLAETIRGDQIDILVDLSGHTARNRLLTFARKPAPIQLTYLGYPSTTGVAAIDYRLTDAFADPHGLTDAFCSEKLVRLPTCAWCFQPLEEAPPATRRSPKNGEIIFGSFNNLLKVSDPLLDIWASLLKRIPNARLLLKSRGLGEADAQGRISEAFSRRGIAADRVELLGMVKEARTHLEMYERMDIALDTFPYHGTTTTCQALWMGVPVVTLAGESHLSRVGVSLLTNVGLVDLVAKSPEGYVEMAARLASDAARCADLRSNLREQMQNSPLMDANRFCRDVEAAYRTLWQKYCYGTSAASVQ